MTKAPLERLVPVNKKGSSDVGNFLKELESNPSTKLLYENLVSKIGVLLDYSLEELDADIPFKSISYDNGSFFMNEKKPCSSILGPPDKRIRLEFPEAKRIIYTIANS